MVTETRGLYSIHHKQQHKKLRALGDEFLPRSNPVTGIFNSTAPAFGFAHGPDTKVNRLVKIEGIFGELKFMLSKKATKIDEIFTVDLTLHNFKSMVKIASIFVAFLDNMNFII